MTVLPEKLYSGKLFANRVQNILPLDLVGGGTMVILENQGLSFRADGLFLPSLATASHEVRDQQPGRTGPVPSLAERRYRVGYLGQRGWTNGELELSYDYLNSQDLYFSNLWYIQNQAAAIIDLDFGSDLEWRLFSKADFLGQTGVIDYNRASTVTALTWNQEEYLSWHARHYFIRTTGSGGDTWSNAGEVGVTYRLYDSLVAAVALDGNIGRVTGGENDRYGGVASLAYTKKIPWDGRFSATVSGGLHQIDQRFNSPDSFVSQEVHAFGTPVATPQALQFPYVVLPSIVVTKIRTGPLPVGCTPPPSPPLPLQEGRDYTLAPNANATLIVPVPCAGAIPGINPGDVVAVDYRYEVATNMGFLMPEFRVELALDFGWIRPYYIHEQFDQNLTWGTGAQFLDQQRIDALGIQFRYDGDFFRGSLGGEARRFQSVQQSSYDALRSSLTMGFSLASDLALSLGASQSYTTYVNPERITRIYTTNVALTWGIAELAGQMYWNYDTISPTQIVGNGTFRLRWFFRALEVIPSFTYIYREQGNSILNQYQAVLSVVRRF
jgi:hypothetical protein